MFQPYTPHVAEELWGALGTSRLWTTPWPTHDEAMLRARHDRARAAGERQGARPHRGARRAAPRSELIARARASEQRAGASGRRGAAARDRRAGQARQHRRLATRRNPGAPGSVEAAMIDTVLDDGEPSRTWIWSSRRLPAVLRDRTAPCVRLPRAPVGSVTVAEDLAQETFLAAVAELKRGRAVETPLPWIFGIARHKLLDHYRRRSVVPGSPRLRARRGELPESTMGVRSARLPPSRPRSGSHSCAHADGCRCRRWRRCSVAAWRLSNRSLHAVVSASARRTRREHRESGSGSRSRGPPTARSCRAPRSPPRSSRRASTSCSQRTAPVRMGVNAARARGRGAPPRPGSGGDRDTARAAAMVEKRARIHGAPAGRFGVGGRWDCEMRLPGASGKLRVVWRCPEHVADSRAI